MKSSSTNYIYRESTKKIVKTFGYFVGDCPIILLVNQKVITIMFYLEMLNVIVESD